jgi:predicted DNA-binding protein YlxM (UPF0122 family)
MLLKKLGRIALLYDLYGPLLTSKQREAVRLYYEQDLSLGEIAAECQVSRQAVYDLLRRAESSLEKYEQKLGLLAQRRNGGKRSGAGREPAPGTATRQQASLGGKISGRMEDL